MRVVHCKVDRCTHYIGRPSVFGNPYSVTVYGRNKCISLFEGYARGSSGLMAAINDLPETAVLGCFCAPAKCHGDVIIKLWKEMHAGEERR